MKIDLYPEKAQYLTNEPIRIFAELDEEIHDECTAELIIYRLSDIVFKIKQAFKGKNIVFHLPGFSENFSGFGVELNILDNDEQNCASTAFDVVSQHNKAIRYGFLSDFDTADQNCEDVETLRKYHINMVQYYDWSYRHDDLVCVNNDSYSDMMGRRVDLNAVKAKISACKKYNMKSLGYGAVYAASHSFYQAHPDWGLYTSAGTPLVFIDIFYIMNVARNSPWRDHIINEYVKAVELVGFDGIHMDTYGFPKTAFSKIENKKTLVKMEEEYPYLIEDTKKALNKIKMESHLIFNNVGNWPVTTVATAPQDAVYIEVWDPYKQYSHIKQIITDAKRACKNEKPVILAAYLEPFRTDTPQNAKNSALLLMAATASNGASNLLLGEKNAVLTQGYYVDHSFLSEEQSDCIRSYYDFIVRYMELLYDHTMEDVSFTHIGWDNTEYRCVNKPWSSDGKADTLWLTIKENSAYKCINLINLCGCKDDLWNKGKDTPIPQQDVLFQVQVDTKIEGIYFASPDKNHCSSQKIDYTLKETDRGIIAEFRVPFVFYWSMVYIKLSDKFFEN